ncbi:MAG: tRNA uridine-5-carboxymethylaminomethyl(34) synthesis enzyme MnmG [Clostridiales bacterium]|nr:tRNA uridine-5-carboxymethylaminomethyl(34) synthesis enzyme MnmG [Clostridiales bacterium]
MDYDVVVIGSGHAGVEACHATAKMGYKTLLLTLNLDSIAFLACNPSIGGTAKGQLVSEIDALGGLMGIMADRNTIQRRMLNGSKGAAVQSLRAQIDKVTYHTTMKEVLENLPNLDIVQAEASEIIVEDGKVAGVLTAQRIRYNCKACIVATGVYLNSKIIIGDYIKDSGPNGFSNASLLTKSLIDLGFKIKRYKTGTPVRVHSDSIDYSNLEVQKGEDNIQNFSYMTKTPPSNVINCYLTYTNSRTHELILNNLDKAPMYTGLITGEGPRYCPSIETKVVRFADKDRHQLFLEPEAMSTKEIYIQGFSTSMPSDIQRDMVHSLEGLENAHIMRDAYAIEYDAIESTQLYPTLEYKNVSGLFMAGQVNGTSGYEEAGAQGIVAGINAVKYIEGNDMLVLGRDTSYIGVLIDDLVTKESSEPYRMMTSRAEYRLHLRQDNADLRLTEIGREFGLVDDDRYSAYLKRLDNLAKISDILNARCGIKSDLAKIFAEKNEAFPSSGLSYAEALRRPCITIDDLLTILPLLNDYPYQDLKEIEIQEKYSGYLSRQDIQISQAKKSENVKLDPDMDYSQIKGLRIEAQQKLNKIKPLNLGQASRISGVSPADIAVLTVFIKTLKTAK